MAFRHELARRAVEAALPVAVRMQYNARVLAALLAGPDPDLARVVHHAVAAGDEAAVVAHAPAAARTASRLGAHTQEVALQEQALRHRHLLDPAEEAALWQEQAMALFTLDRVPDALDAGRRAVRLYEGLGASGPLAEVLIGLALCTGRWCSRGRPSPRPNGRSGCSSPAATAVSTPTRWPTSRGLQEQRRPRRGVAAGRCGGVGMARRLDAPHLVALGEIAHGNARLKQGDPAASTSCARASTRRPRCRPTCSP